MKINYIVSVCCKKDLEVWKIASHEIIKNIEASNYLVIVPDDEFSLFKKYSPSSYLIEKESCLLQSTTLKSIAARMPKNNVSRAGWYYQQLLKISALESLAMEPEGLILIWDADTIPLRNIYFHNNGRLVYYISPEFHQPYFNATLKLLNIQKMVDFSFIAQCFVMKKKWVEEFLSQIESNSNTDWATAILDATDLHEEAGFSEYETLGSWLLTTHSSEMIFSRSPWERFGNSLCGLNGLSQFKQRNPLVDFISFESWDCNGSSIPN